MMEVRRLALGAAVALSPLAACNKTVPFSGSLDTPGSVAVLQSGGPFDGPVAYAADGHGGRIRVLDVQRGTYLAEAPYAVFLRGSGLGTGEDRLLTGIAARVTEAGGVDVIAVDRRYDVLLRVPHVLGVDADGVPVRPGVRVTSVTFDDRDGSGDAPTLASLVAVAGRAGTETWTLLWDRDHWQVEGTRSGVQTAYAWPGRPYSTREGSLRFTPGGAATQGDRFEIVVDTGIRETALPGSPVALALSPDGAQAAVAVADADGITSLLWIDAETGAVLREELPAADARVATLAWDGDTLLAGDGGAPRLWTFAPGAEAVEQALSSPVVDLEVTTSADGARHRLFAVAADGLRVWIYDLATWAPIDVNVVTPEVDPMWFTTGVRGIGGSPLPWDRPYVTDAEEPVTGTAVAVSLQSGKLVWMQEEDGCLVPDALGPRTVAGQSSALARDYVASFSLSPPTTAALQPTEDPNHNVNVNPCAGVAWSEQWQLRYDEPGQVWRATAAISGDQAAAVQEDARYLSDRGQVSLLVRAGERPTLDNSTITFEVVDGALTVDGNEDADPDQEVAFDLPGDPVTAIVTIGGVEVPVVLVAAQSSDVVVRIDPRDASIDRVWD